MKKIQISGFDTQEAKNLLHSSDEETDGKHKAQRENLFQLLEWWNDDILINNNVDQIIYRGKDISWLWKQRNHEIHHTERDIKEWKSFIQEMKDEDHEDEIETRFFDTILSQFDLYQKNPKLHQHIYDPQWAIKKEFFLEEKVEEYRKGIKQKLDIVDDDVIDKQQDYFSTIGHDLETLLQSVIDTKHELETLSYTDENYQERNYELTTQRNYLQNYEKTLSEYYARHGVEFLYCIQELINNERDNNIGFENLSYALDDLVRIKHVLTLLSEK